MKKVVGNVFKVVGKIWNSLLVVGIIGLLLLRFGTVPFGYEPVVCMSNSMAPTFYEGSLCYIDTNYDVDSIKVGDIIAFELNDGSQVTHRVHELTDKGIVTKGDANDDVDISPISKEQIIGENVLQLGMVGELFRSFPNKLLISLVIFCFVSSILLDLISSLLLEEEDADGKKEGTVSSDSGFSGDC